MHRKLLVALASAVYLFAILLLQTRRPDDGCRRLTRHWIEGSTLRANSQQQQLGVATLPSHRTLFLHVPRTAGSTLLHCGLRPAFRPSERCGRSYDTLRVDEACSLLASHHDWRLVEAQGTRAALVVMQLREPVSRLLSAYEFAVIASAHSFGRRKARASSQQPSAGEPTAAVDVWPWNHLVPLLEADMDARARGGNASVVMPFAEFVGTLLSPTCCLTAPHLPFWA